jgi:hypothetical protein
MKLSRRKFLTGSAATAAGAAVATSGISLFSERAEAFFNMGAFWKKPMGNGQTSNSYMIGQSLRSNGTNAFLTRTPVSAGNRKTWTISFWFKRGKIATGSYQTIFDAPNAPDTASTRRNGIGFYGDDTMYVFFNDNLEGGMRTTRTFRDISAWYHIVLAVDTTLSSPASDRLKLFINGVRETSFSTSSNPALNYDTGVNNNWEHSLCATTSIYTRSSYFDGYVSELNFIDGQALDTSYFGQLDTNSGQWIPKAYLGSYGINGLYLKFADNSNTTAATLGKDSSPNGNNWTPNGFASQDQVLDSPTNNFCTLSPLRKNNVNGAPPALTAGNLCAGTQVNIGSSVYVTTVGAWDLPLGKWYWEVFYTSGAGNLATGIVTSASPMPYTGAPYPVFSGTVVYTNSGSITFDDNQNYQTGLATYGVGAVIGVAVDTTGSSNNTVTFFKNGSQVGSTQNIDKRTDWTAWAGPWAQTSESATLNFGQGGQTGLTYDAASGGRFKYTPPTGFKALCTTNLPSAMSVVTSGTFTGNASNDGPFVWLGGAPTDLTINGNVVIWGTHADKLASGFKIRTSSASYNAGSTNSFSATVPAKFKWATARTNP